MPLKLSSGTLTMFDIYGHPIGVNLNGSEAYKTKLGTLMTLATYVLIIVNTVNIWTEFVTRSGQKESY